MFFTGVVFAQCPDNIGFDYGDFTNWQGATGKIALSGTISMNAYSIVNGRHTIFFKKDNQIDPYGKFPIASPNGSSCCVRLGDSNTGAQAEQLTYTFTIPPNDPDYSLIYYYAVVFQNPNHTPAQQPRFTANVFDVTDNKYITCGAFYFEASSTLPGFKISPINSTVYYKSWSAVTLNLLGFSGKTLRLEFTTNDCAQGGHFGYAYLDVNQNCTSPVSGNVYCSNNTGPVTLAAPSGFQQYYWYDASDLSTVIGTSSTLYFAQAPPVGNRYAVRIVPYPGIGCEDTVYTTIKATEPLVLNVKDTVRQCKMPSVNLTDTTITSGSNTDFTYTYFTDAACTNNLLGPQAITQSGTYYIKATSPGGCSMVKPIVLLIGQAGLTVKDPQPVCVPLTVDITAPAITPGLGTGNTLTYWRDTTATKPLAQPSAVDSTGTYYIKLVTPEGCKAIQPVHVVVSHYPVLVITNPPQTCNNADITAAAVTAGSSKGATYSYYIDSLCTSPVPDPKNISVSGTYYIKAIVPGGCFVVKPIIATAPEVLNLQVPDSITVCKVPGLDITLPLYTTGSNSDFKYTYFSDAAGTNPLADPHYIDVSGTYHIKATTPIGCTVIKPVKVIVYDMPDVTVTNPPAVCQPATIDVTSLVSRGPAFSGSITYWKDANATISLAKPAAVDSTGTYYVKAVNNYGCQLVLPVTITVNKLPVLVVADTSNCYSVDITDAKLIAGSSAGSTYAYWADSAGMVPLITPTAVTTSGRYYISATNSNGCTIIKSINIAVYSPPLRIKITDPAPVVYPAVVELKNSFVPQQNTFYTFWRDSLFTKPLINTQVTKGGTYYLREANLHGCYNLYSIKVVVNKPPDIDFSVNVFTPNGDGLNDGFKFNVPFYVKLKSFRVYNSYGILLFETTDPNKYWDGRAAGKYVPVGTYYWMFDARDNYSNVDIKKAGSITVVR